MLEWKADPLDIAENLELPQFQLNDYKTDMCAKEYYTGAALSTFVISVVYLFTLI